MPTPKQKVFDKTKPYGEIGGFDPSLPKGKDGEMAKYEQNGMYFDHNGVYITGEYRAADVQDRVRDQQEQIEELQRKLAAAEGKPAEAPKATLDRAAIVTKLKEKHIGFRPNAKTEELYALLQTELDKE